MRTRDTSWRGIRVLMLLLVGPVIAFAQQNESVPSLRELLNPDGSLRIGKGVGGSFRAEGYQMEFGPRGEPRFRPAIAQSSSQADALADTADIHWDGGFTTPTGFNNAVSVIFVDGGDVYFGGSFTMIGSLPANFIVKWDGAAWSALGTGLNGPVRAIAKFRNDLYVGGYFDRAGGAHAYFVAKWDGNAWSPLGVPPNDGVLGEVRALLTMGDSLYIGGVFSWYPSDTLQVDGLAIWDGSSIIPMPGANVTPHDIRCLASDGNTLYVGGLYFALGAWPSTVVWGYGLIRWNRSTWSVLGTPLQNGVLAKQGLGIANCMVWANGVLHVGGKFDSAGGVSANNIARWNGSAWAPMGAGLNAAVYGLSYFNGKFYAGGDFTASGIDTMNGISWYDSSSGNWNPLSNGVTPPVSTVRGIAHTDSALLVGGRFGTWIAPYGYWGSSKYFAGIWKGGTMVPLGIGSFAHGIGGQGGSTEYGDWFIGQVNAIAISGNNVYVGGNFAAVGAVRANNIACWNNLTNNWSALGEGFDQSVRALALIGTDLYAGGLFTQADKSPANGIARWDGTTWHSLGTHPNDGVTAGSIFTWGAVLSLLAYSGNLYVGGDFSLAGGVNANNIARWNGSSWTALGSGVTGFVSAMDVLHNELYAGGSFGTAGGSPANFIAKWDGVSWRTLGNSPDDGVNGAVYAIHTFGDRVYVGGGFTKAGTAPANYVARWDGSTWSAVGAGVNGVVYVIRSSGESIYAGGDFTASGILNVNHIARWDTASPTWSGLGSGTNSKVFALAPSGNDLFVGGNFTTAGMKGSSWFGRWNSTQTLAGVNQDPPAVRSYTLEQNYPNPFNPSTRIRFSIPEGREYAVGSMETKLVVYDLLGREVAVLVNEKKAPGNYEVRFDASGLASGIYLYRLQAGSYVETKKLVLLR